MMEAGKERRRKKTPSFLRVFSNVRGNAGGKDTGVSSRNTL
jgi:hypothetical protein